MDQEAQVIREAALGMNLCVPMLWTTEQIEAFANTANECGTENGWKLVTDSQDAALGGDKPRIDCAKRAGFVHVVVQA